MTICAKNSIEKQVKTAVSGLKSVAMVVVVRRVGSSVSSSFQVAVGHASSPPRLECLEQQLVDRTATIFWRVDKEGGVGGSFHCLHLSVKLCQLGFFPGTNEERVYIQLITVQSQQIKHVPDPSEYDNRIEQTAKLCSRPPPPRHPPRVFLCFFSSSRLLRCTPLPALRVTSLENN